MSCLLRLQSGPVVVSVLSAKLPSRTSRRQSPCPVCSASNQGKPALSLSCPKHIYQGLNVGRVLSSHKQNVSSADRAHSQPTDKQNSFKQCRQLNDDKYNSLCPQKRTNKNSLAIHQTRPGNSNLFFFMCNLKRKGRLETRGLGKEQGGERSG